MGLLDNLFKPKPESGSEKSVESASGGSGAEPASASSKSQFLAPKIYVPRSSVQIVPPVKAQPQGERKLAPVGEPAQTPGEIVLTLGDVLSRIPAHFLREGKPDLRRELRFPSDGLAADIARGRAAVYLAEIVAQCPDLFLPEVNGFDDIQIRLPLQKLVEQIARGAGNQPPVAKLAPEPLPAPPAAVQPPASLAPVAAGEVQIHLSLAAILRRCPREIIVQPLPPVEESVRVTFPFAPIERQLSTGQVEVSSLRFIAALPLGLMKCFEARAGIKVPLPLEEIFQNLPNQTPPPGAPARFPAVGEPSAETTDRVRENARLAEAMLLEPMPEGEPLPPLAEHVVIKANFVPAPPVVPAPEIREPVFPVAPSPKTEASVAEEAPAVELTGSEKIAAALELEAQLEALAAEDAKSDSQLAEESLLAPLPAPPLEKTPMQLSEPAPEPVPETPASAVEIPPEPAANLPASVAEPVAPPVELPAFRHFAPPLRPPVILQTNRGPGELRPIEAIAPPHPEAVPASAPEPPKLVEPVPESVAPTPEVVPAIPAPAAPAISVPPRAVPPVFAGSVLPSPIVAPPAAVAPEPEPISEKAPPIAADPAPTAVPPPPTVTDPAAQTLRIGPPQFRPFVVHAPPIVFAPQDASSSEPSAKSVAPVPPPLAMQPPIADSRPEFPKEIIAEEPPGFPEIIVEPPVEKHIAPLPDLPPFESASPLLLDGKVREFFQSDAPLPLSRASQLLAALPGIHGCILITRAAESQSGELPAGLHPAAIRDLSQRMRGALSDHAETFRPGEVQHLTLHAEQYSLSLFTRGEACACAIHRARIFLPGVRERFAAVAEELARASH